MRFSQTSSLQRAQALVEFMLFVVVLLLLVGVAVDAGRLYIVYQGLGEAAREGVIYGSVAAGQDDEIRRRAAASSATLHLQPEDVTVTYSDAPCADGDNTVEVTVEKDFLFVAPLTSAFGNGHLHLKVEETALIVAPACP